MRHFDPIILQIEVNSTPLALRRPLSEFHVSKVLSVKGGLIVSYICSRKLEGKNQLATPNQYRSGM